MQARYLLTFMKQFLTYLAAVLLCTLVSCRTVPYTERVQLILTPASYEQKLGLNSYEEYKAENQISTNKAYTEALKRCGDAIVAVSGEPDLEWEFSLFESKTQNAFCLPGGKVAVYTGIVELMNNEAELAFVVAHEIAHALARHGGERMSWGYLKTLGGSLVGALSGSSAAGTLFNKGAEFGVMLPFSRSNEYEADLIGMQLMAKAGYNPEAAVQFWSKFTADSEESILDGMMSTHPRDEERIQAMKGNLTTANALYAQAPDKKGYGISFKK